MSSRTTAVLVLAVALSAPASASARPYHGASYPTRGFELGLRLGVAWSGGWTGDISNAIIDPPGNWRLSAFARTQIPLLLDVGYRFNPSWYLGGYFQYGFANVNRADSSCAPAGVDCSARDIRLGILATYHFRPEMRFAPWLGFGAGLEWFTMSWDYGADWQEVTLSGFELLNLQFGFDGRISRGFSLGPFFSFSLGRFTSASNETSTAGVTADIYNTDVHQWFWLGVRGVFNP